jgi:hypothetical protein
MRTYIPLLWAALFSVFGIVIRGEKAPKSIQQASPPPPAPRAYLGFDRNDYPGDGALEILRKTFSFSGYWLSAPPGEASNSWPGKREILNSNGFGFLVLFNGRLDRQIKPRSNASALGASDAAAAVAAARMEGFPEGTIIFLDQEEGGRMLPEQRAYAYAWVDGVNSAGFRAGIYCSGIAVKEGGGTNITTANDLRDTEEGRKIIFFVYNDACPPSTGCVFPGNPPPPSQSGIPFAAVWQFAQSPRRRGLTASCPSHYDSDGNCYAPLLQGADRVHLDIDSATSPDPSSGRR